jgi:hypothetical protein
LDNVRATISNDQNFSATHSLSLTIGSVGGTLEADKPESEVYNPSAPSFHTGADTLLNTTASGNERWRKRHRKLRETRIIQKDDT